MDQFDDDTKARIIVEAKYHGRAAVAKKYGIHVNSISRMARDARSQVKLNKAVKKTSRAVYNSWRIEINECIGALVRKITSLAEHATIENLKDVSTALERVGNLEQVQRALEEPVIPYSPDSPHAGGSADDDEDGDPPIN